MKKRQVPLVSVVLFTIVGLRLCGSSSAVADDRTTELYAKENLVAWCIVPFDAKQRSPAERAEMLSRMGIRKVAYDWRQKHVPSFEEEILQYRKHELEYFAFWSWHDSMGPLIRKHGIQPQIWQMMKQPAGETQVECVKNAAESLLPLIKTTQEFNCRLGIYNHGGWSGEPENMVAVVEYLRKTHNAQHVGIVYNFHHGHDHIAAFPTLLKKMVPYLLCVNINGMVDSAEVKSQGKKIVPIGDGIHERSMLVTLQNSGYHGPIGILDHRNELDAEKSLMQNLNGLDAMRKTLRTPQR